MMGLGLGLALPFVGAVAATASSIPDVGPGTWTGTATANQTDPARVHAKPAAKWLQPGEFRLWQDMVIGVDCGAKGGIQKVTFFGDCATTVVTTPSLYTDTDKRGLTRVRYGYWIRLKASQYTAASTNGTARIFAKITANDATMEETWIGNNTLSGIGVYDWKMQFYPRTTESDFDKTIGVGGDYSTIDAFFNAARTATAECPKGTIITSGNYDATDGTAGSTGTANAKGCARLVTAPGIVATIKRTSTYDGTNLESTYWRPGWPSIRFEGLITLDLNNLSGVRLVGANDVAPIPYVVIDGAKLTCSNVNWATYWNAGVKVAFSGRDDNNNSSVGYARHFIDCIAEYQNSPFGFSGCVSGVKGRNLLNDPFDHGCMAVNTYFLDCQSYTLAGATTPGGAKNGVAALTLAYTGAGTATIDIPQNGPTAGITGGDVTSGTLVLKVNGSAVATITLGYNPTIGNMDMMALAATINAVSGWSMTVIANVPGGRYLQTQSGLSITSTPTTLKTIVDIHTEFFHGFGTTVKNIIHRGNITRGDMGYSSGIWYEETAVADAWVVNNSWWAINQGGGSGAQSNGFHVNLLNNLIESGMNFASGHDAYSQFTQNVVAYWETAVTGLHTNNALEGGSVTISPSPDANGNISLGVWNSGTGQSATYTGCYPNRLTGDFTPAGALTANLRASIEPYDANYNVRATNDCMGPWANGGTQPTWFDFASAP